MMNKVLYEALNDILDICISYTYCDDCPLWDNGQCLIDGTPQTWNDTKFNKLLEDEEEEEDDEED